jgi:16S rRNA (uracil1498-N3)-methyltransferase
VRPRFYLPSLDASGVGALDEEEAGHLTRVLRLGAGAEIDVFDGRGRMFRARVVEAKPRRVVVHAEEPVPAAPEPAVHVTLVTSVLKGDKMDDVVRDAAMMGVAAIQPVFSAHGEVSMEAVARGHRWERWQRIAVSSVKQCGRATVPDVRAPRPLSIWMARGSHEPVLVLIEPRAGTGVALSDLVPSSAVLLLVGPEGGWSPDEAAAFEAAGFQAVSLGGRTLRADSVPLVALAALFEAWKAW